MLGRRIIEFSRAATYFPTLTTKRFNSSHTKTVTIFLLVVLQPLQGLSLWAGDRACAFKRSDDRHTCFHLRDDCHLPSLANLTLGLAVNVAQISHHNVGAPPKATPAIVNARLEQITLGNASWREPTDHWNQTNR